MKFEEEYLIVVNSLTRDEASAFIKFLQSEIIMLKEGIEKAENLIEVVRAKGLDR